MPQPPSSPEPRSLSAPTFLGLLLFALLSYFQFPGHIWLESDTQIYLPMLERFRDPSLFERDPMVIRAHTAFTLYDELALALDRLTGWGFEGALGLAHVVVRLALLAGIFLITRAMGLSEALALACAGVYALGGRVLGPAVLLVEYEPVPRAFALGPVVLAIGLAARERYLAAGIAGAAGFLMHPTTAAPFWIVYAALLFVPDDPETMKARLWGLAPLAAAVVALKAAAALQPGVVEPQAILGRLDSPWEALIRMRASYVFVSLWPPLAFWQFGLMTALAAAAYWRLRRFLTPTLRFFAGGLLAAGWLALPLSYLLLERLRWAMLPQWQPLRWILFAQVFAMLLSLVLAFELACRERRLAAAACWAAAGIACGLEPRLLFVLAPAALASLLGPRLGAAGLAAAAVVAWIQPLGIVVWQGAARRALLLALSGGILLAAAGALSARRRRSGAAAVLAVAVAAFYFVPGRLALHWSGERSSAAVQELAEWALAQTNRDAVFLFFDARRAVEPGVFRARAARALYADWKGGGQINFFREFARLWSERWRETAAGDLRPERLPHFRELGIDYLVVAKKNRLADRPAAHENDAYLVYALR